MVGNVIVVGKEAGKTTYFYEELMSTYCVPDPE